MFQKLFKPASLRGLTKMGVSSLRRNWMNHSKLLSATQQNSVLKNSSSSSFNFSSKPKIS